MVDYELYRRMCEYLVEPISGTRLPLRLTLPEEQEAISALNLLAIEQYL